MTTGPEPGPERERAGERAANAIYGSIIVLAVIVAERDAGVSAAAAVASVISAAAITALAEIYAHYIGETIRTRRHPTAEERRLIEGNVVIGFGVAILPAGFFVLAELDVISLETAFDIAIWSGVAILGAHAVVANHLAGLPRARGLLLGLAFTLLGAALVGIKAAI